MGADLNKELNNNTIFLEKFDTVYQQYSKTEDSVLGEISVFQEKQIPSNFIAIKNSHFMNSPLSIEQYLRTYMSLSLNQYKMCPYLIKTAAFAQVKQSGIGNCGSSDSLNIYFEYTQNKLSNEIQQRKQRGIPFSEADLYLGLYSLLTASKFLENLGQSIDDIKSSTVFKTEEGTLKVLPFRSFLEQEPLYQKLLLNMTKNDSFPAPELLEDARAREMNTKANPYKCESFSIGMVILECATLQDVSVVYDWKTTKINTAALEGLIKLAAQKYQKFLIKILTILLQIDPKERFTPSDIVQMLQPYELEITQLKSFYPDKEYVEKSINKSQKLDQKSPMVENKSPGVNTRIQQSPVPTNTSPFPTLSQQQTFMSQVQGPLRQSTSPNKYPVQSHLFQSGVAPPIQQQQIIPPSQSQIYQKVPQPYIQQSNIQSQVQPIQMQQPIQVNYQIPQIVPQTVPIVTPTKTFAPFPNDQQFLRDASPSRISNGITFTQNAPYSTSTIQQKRSISPLKGFPGNVIQTGSPVYQTMQYQPFNTHMTGLSQDQSKSLIDLEDIDRRIKEVLRKTNETLEKLDNQ